MISFAVNLDLVRATSDHFRVREEEVVLVEIEEEVVKKLVVEEQVTQDLGEAVD